MHVVPDGGGFDGAVGGDVGVRADEEGVVGEDLLRGRGRVLGWVWVRGCGNGGGGGGEATGWSQYGAGADVTVSSYRHRGRYRLRLCLFPSFCIRSRYLRNNSRSSNEVPPYADIGFYYGATAENYMLCAVELGAAGDFVPGFGFDVGGAGFLGGLWGGRRGRGHGEGALERVVGREKCCYCCCCCREGTIHDNIRPLAINSSPGSRF